MNITVLIIHLISGAIGGNVGGSLIGSFLSNSSLGPVGNSVVGMIGGGLCGYLFNSMLTSAIATNGGAINLTSIIFSVFGGGFGGTVAVAVVGLIKSKMSKG